MKAYTDLLQSKILAKILPIESADMNYWCGTQIRIGGHRTMDKDLDIPCWSLAALLDILPDKVVIDGHRWGLSLGKKRISYLGHMTFDGQLHISVEGDNLLDACVDIKERNLI